MPSASLVAYKHVLLDRLAADDEECVRVAAVMAMGRLPTQEHLLPLITTLLSAFDDKAWRVHRAVMEVLVPIPGPALVPHATALLSRLEHSDARVREFMVAALGKLSAALSAAAIAQLAPTLISALQPLVQDADRRVRERAVALLGRIEPHGPSSQVKSTPALELT